MTRKKRKEPMLPTFPLWLAVDQSMKSVGYGERDLMVRVGISPRLMYGWRTGRIPRTSFWRADIVLTNLSTVWRMVFNERTVRTPILRVWTYVPETRRGKRYFSRGERHYGDAGPDYEELARIANIYEGSWEKAA